MASSAGACAVNKCETSACAVCHCCQNDLCLDHLKEHRDQLNTKLIPLANQINTFLDNLEHFIPTSTPGFQVLEQWRIAAHVTVDQYYERMRDELFEQKKNKPLERLHATRHQLDQLIRKQGATRDNINSLTNDIQLIEREINSLQNIQINLRPLVIDDNAIIQSDSSNRTQSVASVDETDQQALQNGLAFQIFVQLPTEKKTFITVKPSDTIMDVKRKIQEKKGIAIDDQRLMWMGKQLTDDYSIATYGIQRQSTINLVFRLRALKNDDPKS